MKFCAFYKTDSLRVTWCADSEWWMIDVTWYQIEAEWKCDVRMMDPSRKPLHINIRIFMWCMYCMSLHDRCIMEDTNTCIRTHTRTHVRTHTHTHTPSSPAPAVTVQWLGPRQRPHRTHRHLWLRDLPLTDPDLGWLKRKVGLACSGLWPSLGLHLHSVWDNMGGEMVRTQMRSVVWFSHKLSACDMLWACVVLKKGCVTGSQGETCHTALPNIIHGTSIYTPTYFPPLFLVLCTTPYRHLATYSRLCNNSSTKVGTGGQDYVLWPAHHHHFHVPTCLLIL